MEVFVENIKCGGCANSIRKKLISIEGVEAVDVTISEGRVIFELAEDIDPSAMQCLVEMQLKNMGYPKQGSVNGLESAGAKAKSFVSCAIGKIDV